MGEESRTSPRKDSKSRKKLKDKSPGKDTDSSHSRKKKKTHPEDAVKHDVLRQDAKQQQEQSQDLMQQAWDAESSLEAITGISEANKNKMSSDEAKSIEDKADSKSKVLELDESKEAKSLGDKADSKKKTKKS